jgi:hypothetical protein
MAMMKKGLLRQVIRTKWSKGELNDQQKPFV